MGSKVGRQKGQTIETKKQKKAKRYIRANYKAFGGILSASECMRVVGITKSTFYRYLDQIVDQDKENGIIWENVKRTDDYKKNTDVQEIQNRVKEFHIKNKK